MYSKPEINPKHVDVGRTCHIVSWRFAKMTGAKNNMGNSGRRLDLDWEMMS
jgi:hypothetical protein